MAKKQFSFPAIQSQVAWHPRGQQRMLTFEWGGVFEQYARGFVKRNHWRVKYLLGDEEDAMQEAAMVFMRCKRLYDGKLDQPKWMMALFKRSLAMQWHTLSTKDSQRRIALEENLALTEVIGFDEQPNPGHFLASLASQGSEELQELVSAILESPGELLEVIAFAVKFHVNDPDTLNARAKKLLGITTASMRDLFAELRDLLTLHSGV